MIIKNINAMNLIKTAQFRFGIEFLHTLLKFKVPKEDSAVMQQKNHVWFPREGSMHVKGCNVEYTLLISILDR